ncbi:DUF2206 domain-containing protein [Halobellus clavatus]|uniref:Uncharacterized membrane protein n=1 Tax=Halobellus clavatus TaxID=660517 RepID=A0A1H3JX53_9EURY|nr:DUF2206 domain-containing protein [Halobellus clavatus]SDY44540.1 Uncharacterized membrane protein [Halobellus clavatus]
MSLQHKGGAWAKSSLRSCVHDNNAAIVTFASFGAVLYTLSVTIGASPLQSGLGFLLVAVMPGVLILGALGRDLDDWLVIPYVVVISLAYTMAVGALASVTTHGASIPSPFRPLGFYLWYGGGFAILLVLFRLRGFSPALPGSADIRTLKSRHTALAVFLLLNVVLGAWLLNDYNTNSALIATLVLISLTPLFVVLDNPDRPSQIVSAWLLSLALLLQNTLIDINLQAGDGRFEHSLGMVSLIRGYYDPMMLSVRATSLRLTVLNPAFSLATETDLSIAATVFHPLTLSVIAIGVFILVERQYSTRVAYLSVIVVAFSVPWLNTMSRNTRTATALLFAVVAVCALFDASDNGVGASVVLILSLCSIPATHYGAAPMFLVLLTVALVSQWLWNTFFNGSEHILQVRHLLSMGLVLGGWFLYAAQGSGFEFMVLAVAKMVASLLGSTTATSQAGTGASLAMPSLTYQIIKIEYIVVLGFAAIGLVIGFTGLVWPERFSGERMGEHVASDILPAEFGYYAIGAGAACLVPLAFLPKVGLGIPRIFVFSMLFLAPFAILTAVAGLRRVRAPPMATIAAVLAVLLLINSGGIAAAVTHDNSPQPYLDKPYRLEHGSENTIYELYRVYRSDRGWSSSDWLYNYARGEQLYGSGVQPPMRTSELTGRSPLERPSPLMEPNATMCDGFIRLTPGDYQIGEVVITHHPNFVYYGNQSIPLNAVPTEGRNKVFAAGQTNVYTPCK